MKQKKISKFAVVTILLLLMVGLFTSLSNVNGTSAETTGLSLTNNNTNQDMYVIAGSYTIYITPTIAIFYNNNDGTLAKTYAISPSGILAKIFYINESYVLIGYVTSSTPIIKSILLSINTLSATVISTSSISNYYGCTFFFYQNKLFALYTYASAGYKTVAQQIYPTLGSASSDMGATGTYIITNTNNIYVFSKTELNTFYFISWTTGNRYNIWKINFVTPLITNIGTSATDNTFSSNYNYIFGYSYDTDGTNSWYDIGIVYDNPSMSKDIYPAIIRFNDTFVDVNHRSTLSASSSVNILRCMNVFYSGIWDTQSLLEGNYGFLYVGTTYGMMMCPFNVTGLSTTSPNLSIGNAPSVYGDNGVQWIHHYTSSNNIGGILAFSGISVQLDYQNSKAVCDKWMALNPSYAYVFSLIPTPQQIIGSGTVLRAVCMYGTQYTYNGEIFANGVRVGNGTYQVSTTGLSTNYNIAINGVYGSTSNTGSIVNGLITFTISPRTSAYVTIYEGIKVTVIINGASQDFIHTFVWTSNVDENGLPPTSPIPTQGNGNGNGGDTGLGGMGGVNLLNGSTFVGIFIVVLFTLLLGAFAGRDGIFAGLMVGFFLSSILGFFPIYGVLLAVVFGAILIFSHTGVPSLPSTSNGDSD